MQGGVLDFGQFVTNVGTAANDSVSEISLQPDKKILLGGNFTTWNGATVNRIVRLNPDGTIDTVFTTNVGTGANNTVNDIAIQPNGQILIVGSFSTWNGVTVNRMVRLNANGTVDAEFTDNFRLGAPASFTPSLSVLAVQSDGKVVTHGLTSFTFYDFSTGTFVTNNTFYTIRANIDGTMDTSFNSNTSTAANNDVNSIALQPDGKIVLGGNFTTWNGTTVNRIVRLNSSGTRETAFTTNTGTGANGSVDAMAIQPDGKIILGGGFTTFNGVTVNRIVRLNPDGTRDTAFTTNTGTASNSSVRSIAIQSDGKILVGGQFTTWNGATVNRIVRLNPDGTRDTAFTTNTGTGADNGVVKIVPQLDGKIIAGGLFAAWNAVTANRIVRIGGELAL